MHRPFGPLAFVGRMQIEELAAGMDHAADFGCLAGQTVMHQNLHADGAAVGEQAQCGLPAPNTAITLASAVSVPARTSMGSVASQMASMRITD